MNQRVKRSSRRHQLDQVVMGSSAHPARQSTDRSSAEVVLPQKTTGDADAHKKTLKDKLEGLAKASPLFEQVEPKEVEDKERALAENTVDERTKKSEDK